MPIKRIFALLALAAVLTLAACSPAPTRRTLEPTQAGGPTGGTTAGTEEVYPAPNQFPGNPAYPVEEMPQETIVNELWMAYPPAPGDETMERGNFMVEAATITTGPFPGTFDLTLEGNLPTGCNQPRVVVNPPGADNVIQIEAYSVRPTDMACAEVLSPYVGRVATIAGFPAGTYTVMVNGEVEAGEITLP